jgi:serine protease
MLTCSMGWCIAGDGVHVYMIDTGILETHSEFEGRLRGGVDFVDLDFVPDDCNGHGTHCAGVVGGTKWGVAKKVSGGGFPAFLGLNSLH